MIQSSLPPPSRRRTIEELEGSGFDCYYVRFHGPVPVIADREPVYEFRIGVPGTPGSKYAVDRITWTEQGVVWRAKDEIDITPLANVVYARLTRRVGDESSQ